MSAIENFSMLAQKCITTCFLPPLVKLVVDGSTEGKNEEEVLELFMKTLAISQTTFKIPTLSAPAKKKPSAKAKSKPQLLSFEDFYKIYKDGYYCSYMGSRGKMKGIVCAAELTEDDLKACDGDRSKLHCTECKDKSSDKFIKVLTEKENNGLAPSITGVNFPDLRVAESVKNHLSGNNEISISPVLTNKRPTKSLSCSNVGYNNLKHDDKEKDYVTKEGTGVHWLLRRTQDKKVKIVGALTCERGSEENEVTIDYLKHIRKLTDEEDELRQNGFSKVYKYEPDENAHDPVSPSKDDIVEDEDEDDIIEDEDEPEEKIPSVKAVSPVNEDDLEDDELDLIEDEDD